MGMPAMKAYLGFREQEPPFGYKRFRPLAPKLTSPTATATATAATTKFDPKRFIRQESKSGSSDQQKQECTQVETHGASTRWNPTREQIGILEMVYKGGLRSPNAHQIEQITAQLAVYGRIEGKNVFYWFQNHKARDRQKQKRDALAHTPPSHFTDTSSSQLLSSQGEGVEEGMSCISQKRKSCLLPEEEEEEEVGGDRTLKLFPLHPGGLK